jgi:predicted Rossmann fold flavoprotein
MPPRVVVIGGGAAGFFCAVNAARLGAEVTLLEKTSKVLSKVRVSGGGRCNVTHACDSIPDMVRAYPRGGPFLKKAFSHFFVPQTIDWFAGRGVPLKTEADGRMFPVSDSSETIIDCLVAEARRYNVQLRLNRDVTSLHWTGAGWRINIASEVLDADAVVIACGGFPKASHFAWLEALGHTISPPLPSLFTFNLPGNPLNALMGVSVPFAQVRITGTRLVESGPLLITHWGCSGPVILRLSAWGAIELASRNYSFTALVNWIPDQTPDFQALRRTAGGSAVSGKNAFGLPQRLWQFLVSASGIADDVRWGDLPAAGQHALIRNLSAFELPVRGKTTFKEEFVTCGGIHRSEVDPATMQSRIQPNLYFIGEILDVDGITGGYNFQHAWTSAWIAANAIVMQ